MRDTDIYQTLEDRQNYGEVEEHGPYFCYAQDDNGIPKKGVKEPWLGEGYYFCCRRSMVGKYRLQPKRIHYLSHNV